MKVVKQKQKLHIVNLDCLIGDIKSTCKKHSELLPNDIRAIICGPSGCGKSNVILSLLFDLNGLKFQNVYVYSKSLYQPKYIYLENVLNGITGIKYFSFSNNDCVLSPSEVNNNSIFIFDDVICENQNKIRDFFCMGRHKNIDCFYLCQTYTKIPKHLIRDNVNLIVIFKQDNLNLKHIYHDHVYGDMNFDTFVKLCEEGWKNKYDFIVINKEDTKGRYRRGFDQFINYKEH